MNITRRQFIEIGAATTAASMLSLNSFGAAAKTTARPIGFSLYGMKTLPVLDALDHCARIGYNNIEICVMDEFPTQLDSFTTTVQDAVRDRLKKRGLEVSSILFQGNIFRDDRQKEIIDIIKRSGEISHRLDKQNPPLLESVMAGKKEEWESSKHMMVDRLHTWAEAAGSVGVKVSVKAHYGHAAYSTDRLLWLYRTVNHPNLALTYDYSHFKAEGFEMEETMRALVPYASFIHVKDVAPWKPVRFLYPGEGTIDWVKYFRIIRELKYAGPILVEVSAHIHRLDHYEPIPAAENCYKSLSEARDIAYGEA